MLYENRHVVITGGTGALGIAVVGALLDAGATCHVPYIHAGEAERYPHRDHARVTLVANANVADEEYFAEPVGPGLHDRGQVISSPGAILRSATMTILPLRMIGVAFG